MTNETPYLAQLYSANINEIDRYRDWPIRILTFTSALHFAIIGAFILKGESIKITECIDFIIILFLIVLGIWTIAIFHHCHIHYLEARNTQAKIQKYMGLNKIMVDNVPVFPDKWFKVVNETGCEKPIGWLFYVFYSIALTICACWTIWTH